MAKTNFQFHRCDQSNDISITNSTREENAKTKSWLESKKVTAPN